MGQQAAIFEKQVQRTLRLRHLLHLPTDYGVDPRRTWPLILFLHGVGERGEDIELVKKHGVAKVAERQPDFPFIAVSPQCPEYTWWSDHIEALDGLLAGVCDRYAVDLDRVYLTGLSMGAYGAWHLATVYPLRFAAVVPICGGGAWHLGFPERVCTLKDTPVWAFHGALDDVVPLAESEKMVNALVACGGEVRFTVYPHAPHDSWTETYDNAELYAWMLRQRRRH